MASNNLSIDPIFISGLIDAEGSFVITISKNPKLKAGWRISPRLQIKMHEKDRALIQSIKIKAFFGGIGSVSKPNKFSSVEFRVYTLKEIVEVVIPHFESYPLKTKKYTDYLLFKQIVFRLLNKQNNSFEDIQEIINIKASINWGLSDKLKLAFPNTAPVIRPEYNNEIIIENSWLAGFATGESKFL